MTTRETIALGALGAGAKAGRELAEAKLVDAEELPRSRQECPCERRRGRRCVRQGKSARTRSWAERGGATTGAEFFGQVRASLQDTCVRMVCTELLSASPAAARTCKALMVMQVGPPRPAPSAGPATGAGSRSA